MSNDNGVKVYASKGDKLSEFENDMGFISGEFTSETDIKPFPIMDSTEGSYGAINDWINIHDLKYGEKYVATKNMNNLYFTDSNEKISDDSYNDLNVYVDASNYFDILTVTCNDNYSIDFSYGCFNYHYSVSKKKFFITLKILKTDNNEGYTPTSDYNPSTKKYVDDSIKNLPQLSFNDTGELVVTIDGVSKVFAPKEATTLTVDESTGVLKVGASAASAE